MKKVIYAMLVVATSAVLMSYITVKKEKEPTKVENNVSIEEALNSDCWWNESHGSNFRIKRGETCGSDSSLKIWFTNPYSYSIRVAFYLEDSNGNLSDYAPYVERARPGEKVYHHQCYSNGRYVILAARADASCTFPKLN